MDPAEHQTYEAAIRGDRDAFESVIREMSRPLFAIAYGILQNREEAEDAVQDTFVKAWKSRWRVRDPQKFPAWLGTIARHRAHDISRRRRALPLAPAANDKNEPDAELDWFNESSSPAADSHES